MRFSFKRKRTKKVRPISNVRKNLIFVKAKPAIAEPTKSEEKPVMGEVVVEPITLAQPLQSDTSDVVEEKVEVSPAATEQVADTEEVTFKPKPKKRTTKTSTAKTTAAAKEEK